MDKQNLAILGGNYCWLHFTSCRRIESASDGEAPTSAAEFRLLKRDLDRLEELNAEINSVIIPTLPAAEHLKDLQQAPGRAFEVELEKLNAKMGPSFKKIAAVTLRNQSVFSKDTQDKMLELFRDAEGGATSVTLARRYEFVAYVQSAINEQIKQIREQWRR